MNKAVAPSKLDDLLSLAPHMEIVHHIPGRIRIRVLPSGFSLAVKLDVKQAIDAIPGIGRVRVNPVVGSVVIEYDRTHLTSELWKALEEIRLKPDCAPAAGARIIAIIKEKTPGGCMC